MVQKILRIETDQVSYMMLHLYLIVLDQPDSCHTTAYVTCHSTAIRCWRLAVCDPPAWISLKIHVVVLGHSNKLIYVLFQAYNISAKFSLCLLLTDFRAQTSPTWLASTCRLSTGDTSRWNSYKHDDTFHMCTWDKTITTSEGNLCWSWRYCCHSRPKMVAHCTALLSWRLDTGCFCFVGDGVCVMQRLWFVNCHESDAEDSEMRHWKHLSKWLQQLAGEVLKLGSVTIADYALFQWTCKFTAVWKVEPNAVWF